MDAFLHLADSVRPIAIIKDCQTSKSQWVAIFDDGEKLFFGGKNDSRKQRFMATLVQTYGIKYVVKFSRKYPLEFAMLPPLTPPST
jgi:hypothetical protein